MFLLRAEQAAQVPALIGKTFTVGEVTSAGDGINKWLVLHSTGKSGAAAAKGSVILKVEGGRQLPALIGKTVTVGKGSMTGAGAASKWLALYPTTAGAQGAARAGAVGAGTAGKGSVILGINDPTGQVQALAGQTYTVGQGPVGQVANKWLVLHPASGAATKSAAATKAMSGGSLLAGGTPAGGKALFAKTVAAGKTAAAGNTAAAAGKIAAAGAAGASAAAKGAASGGTIWTASGLSLGLGLGLGPVGPAILAAALAAGGYYLYSRMRKKDNDAETEVDLDPALGEAVT